MKCYKNITKYYKTTLQKKNNVLNLINVTEM
nr:MAG TPA: hypothetical protein [Caudoviricetes sp.]